MQLINDLGVRVSRNQTKIKEAINRVLASGWLILGPECKKFEQSFAHYVQTEYCVGVANGTDAIELALKGLGIKEGDQVATVANAGMYTTTALLAIGAVPYFMDVDLKSRNTTLAEVMKAAHHGVKAIVVTHLYGLATPEIKEIAEFCKKKQVALLEDCAQAHGARLFGKQVGSFGDVASFSFYPTKNLGALGDGGAVVTSNKDLADTIRRLSQYGWSAKYRVETAGARNSRLDELQAAILSEFLPQLDENNARRRNIAQQYNSGIKHPLVQTNDDEQGENYVAHLYVIRSTKRDDLQLHLRRQNIASDIHYPIPDYRQPLFGERFAGIQLPNTECLSQETLSLPCYPEMTDDEVNNVIRAVNAWTS